jgi:lipopolysaccharide assembly outer membrane protein LptD (OstA)
MPAFHYSRYAAFFACVCTAFCAASFAAAPSDTAVKAPAALADTGAVRGSPVLHTDTTRTAAGPPIAPVKPAKGKAPGDTSKSKGPAVYDTVYYGADGGYIDYDVENKQLKLINNAVVKYQDITLNADSITYYMEDGLLIAKGKPQLVEKHDTTVGESMIYNIKTKRGRVKYASAHMDDAYFNGNKIVKAENNDLYIEEGNYTTCAFVDTPDYFFYGKTIKVIPNSEVISRPVVFALGDAPVAWLPYFAFPLERNRKSGLLTPIWGGHPESGGYLDNLGYYFVPNDYIDATAWMRIQEFNNFVFNGATRYAMKYWLSGSLTGQYANAGTFLSRSQQWSLDYTHNQNITPDGNTTLSGRGSMVGTNSFYTTYSEDSTQILNQNLNANMSLSQRIPSINGSANITWNRNMNLSTGEVSEDLPSASFSLPSRPLIPFTPKENATDKDKEEEAWYNKIDYSYSANGLLRNYFAAGDTGQNYQRKALLQSFSLSSPQNFFKYITVTPSFNAQASTFDMWMDTSAGTAKNDTQYIPDTIYDTLTRAQWYAKSPQPHVSDTVYTFNSQTQKIDTTLKAVDSVATIKRPQYKQHNDWSTDYSWNAGVSVGTNLYGVFPIHIFNFAGLRHTFTPSLSYTYTPKHDLDKQYTPLVSYAPAKDKPSQSVGININNEFQGKLLDKPAAPGDKPAEKKIQLLTAAVSTAYDFEAPTRKFSDLSVSANTGYEVVRVGYSSTFWMYDQNDRLSLPLLHQYSVSISPSNSLSLHGSLWEGDKIAADSLQPKFDLHYLRAGPQQWQAGISPQYTFSQSRNSPTDPFITTKQYSLSTSASINFTRNWSMSWSSTYNFVTNQFVDHDVHFHYEQECWDMRFDWRPSGYNPGYYFLINIKKIPELKWEQRND